MRLSNLMCISGFWDCACQGRQPRRLALGRSREYANAASGLRTPRLRADVAAPSSLDVAICNHRHSPSRRRHAWPPRRLVRATCTRCRIRLPGGSPWYFGWVHGWQLHRSNHATVPRHEPPRQPPTSR